MEKGLVSVITPCYNGEKFIEQYVNSLLTQKYKKLEIIFVNDGSVDSSEELILTAKQRLINEGYSFKYFKIENQGAASACNYALKHITGEYIILFDIDDILLPEAISIKVEFLNKNLEYGIIRNNGYFVSADDPNVNLKSFIQGYETKEEESLFEDLLYGISYNWPGSFMIRTCDFIKGNQGLEIYCSQFGQNLQFMLPVAYVSKSYFINMYLMKYLRHENAHSAVRTYEKMLSLYNGYMENRVEILKGMHLSEETLNQYVKEIYIRFSKIRLELAEQYHMKDDMDREYHFLKNKKRLSFRERKEYYFSRYAFLRRIAKIKNEVMRKKKYVE